MLKTVYSISEVADYFKVSTRTIRVWLEKDGSFPRPFKKYGTLRFRCSDIEQYWKDNMLLDESNMVLDDESAHHEGHSLL